MGGEIKKKTKAKFMVSAPTFKLGRAYNQHEFILQGTITHSAFKSFILYIYVYNKQECFPLVLVLILPNKQLYVVSSVHGRTQSLITCPCEFPCIYSR